MLEPRAIGTRRPSAETPPLPVRRTAVVCSRVLHRLGHDEIKPRQSSTGGRRAPARLRGMGRLAQGKRPGILVVTSVGSQRARTRSSRGGELARRLRARFTQGQGHDNPASKASPPRPPRTQGEKARVQALRSEEAAAFDTKIRGHRLLLRRGGRARQRARRPLAVVATSTARSARSCPQARPEARILVRTARRTRGPQGAVVAFEKG